MVVPPNAGPSSTAAAVNRGSGPASSSTPNQTQPKQSSPQLTAPTMNSNVPLSARRADPLDMQSVERRGKPLFGTYRPEPPKRNHIYGIQEAPTFRPTLEEWQNPMNYIQKIAPEGRKYGICKIVPPDSWDPDFAIDSTRFHFRTRKQELNSVEGATRANLDYLDRLGIFHKSQGGNLNRFPSVDKRPLDLYELKKAVESRGGFERVCKGKKWAEIGRILGYSGKIMSSLSTSLKNSYAKWLEPYERFLAGAKPAVQWQMEKDRGGPYATPSPNPSPAQASKLHTPSKLSREASAIIASENLQASIEDNPHFRSPLEKTHDIPKPTSGFTAVNSTAFTPANAPPKTVTPASSQNGVLKPVSEKKPANTFLPTNGFGAFQTVLSAPIVNTYAPYDLKRSHSEAIEDADPDSSQDTSKRPRRLKHDSAPTVTGSHMMPHRASTPRPSTWQSGDFCETCEKSNDDSLILICDSCYLGYHTYCLDPPLAFVPENDWHCPKCLVGTGEFGFEEGSTYSLGKFQKHAFEFKQNHFANKMPFDPITNGPKAVTEEDVEREFWRLVSSLTETVEVEYGADIHSTTHGSGFPTLERNPRNAYSTDPWNLNILPLHQDSLFRHIKSDISGMTVPWLYVGMVFSTFCWHNEDHYTYSANYQHFGSTKTWYGIPGEDALRFEDAMREAVPDLFEKQPDLLFQLVTLLPPDRLKKAGINVFAADQRAGQFIVTFPQAYHAGFNHGFNFNEAVNFAPSDWEPFGKQGVNRLQDFRRQPCFSHDELLLTAAASKDISIKTAKWLAPALQRVVEEEQSIRARFQDRLRSSVYFRPEFGQNLPFKDDTEDLPEEDYVCDHCKCFSYLSRYVCANSKKITCLDHINNIICCDQPLEGHAIHERISNRHMEKIAQKIADKAKVPELWIERFETAIADTPKPQLKIMRAILAEGEKIPWDLPQLSDLKAFVDDCNDWVEEAMNYITRKQQNRRKNEKAWRKGSQAKMAEMEERDRELRKLDNIKKLLNEADRIGFECPEILTLQQRADEITEFQKEARVALTNIATQTTQQIEELIELGKGYFVDIPEVDHLDKIVRQMKWKDRASARPLSRSLHEVKELIEEASELNVPEVNEYLTYLKDKHTRGEKWEAKAAELIAVENVHYAQLDAFSKQATDLPVTKETTALIDAILKKQRDAQEQIQGLYKQSQRPNFRERPLYKDIITVMEDIAKLNSKPQGTLDLEKQQRRHEDWMRRGKKLFGKSNAPLHILSQHMKLVENRNKHCFDLADRYRPPVEPSSREASPEEGQPPPTRDVFCLCRTPESGMMIECHVCHEWYHSRCLKIARGKVKEDDDFCCPVCDWRVKIPRDATRPKLEDLISLQSAIPTLPFQPDEEECLDGVINDAQAFRDQMQQYVNPNPILATHEEVPIMRHYLRKIEGADILLANETNFFRQELHRLFPVAPEAPQVIEVSSSTRKPRPTKQQKLMAQHGVETPDELPQHLRTKPYNFARRKQQDEQKDARQSTGPGTSRRDSSASGKANGINSQSGTPTTINFRPPLTTGTFPQISGDNRNLDTSRPASPMFSASSNGPFNENGSTVMPLMRSPFGNGITAAAEVSNANLDPSLFDSAAASMAALTNSRHRMTMSPETDGDRARDLQNEEALQTDDNDGPNFGDNQQGGAAYDSMFADLTNQDEPQEASEVVGDSSPRMNGYAVETTEHETTK